MITEDRVETIMRQLVEDASDWTDETLLSCIDGWDSMVQINLMFALEQQLGVKFNGNEIFEFETVGDIKRFARANSTADPMRFTSRS